MNICILCHSKSAARLCPHCTTLLPRIEHSCQRCGRPLPVNSALCGQCQIKPPTFDQVITPFAYLFPITELCIAFKHQHHFAAGYVLAEKLVSHINFHQYDIILPVPLHPKRLQQRGYNQAAYLATVISKLSGVDVNHHLIHKHIHTLPQAELNATLRHKNLKNAFYSNSHAYKKIAIIDDIVTTGATGNAIATCLKQQNNCHITIIAPARALL